MTDEVAGFAFTPHPSIIRDFCHLPLKGKALGCRVQHVFDEDAVAGIRLVDENMGDGADELAVLDNGTAGHADVK